MLTNSLESIAIYFVRQKYKSKFVNQARVGLIIASVRKYLYACVCVCMYVCLPRGY